MRKVLVSPGYGAGWSSWAPSPEVSRFMLEYEPIIAFMVAGGKFEIDSSHPLLQRFQEDVYERFGFTYVCVDGAHQLKVVEVSGPVRISEFDGFEEAETPESIEWR